MIKEVIKINLPFYINGLYWDKYDFNGLEYFKHTNMYENTLDIYKVIDEIYDTWVDLRSLHMNDKGYAIVIYTLNASDLDTFYKLTERNNIHQLEYNFIINNVDLFDKTVNIDVILTNININNIFVGKTVFTKNADFSGTIFNTPKHSPTFSKTTFKKIVFFQYTKFISEEKITFKKANFEDKAYFNLTYFYSNVDFTYAKFGKDVFFEKTTFMGITDLRKTNIKTLYLQNIKFGNLFFLNDSLIEDFILGSISFIDGIGKEITSENKILNRYIDILNGISDKDKYDIQSFRQTCCLLKDTYIKQSNYIDSNLFYALEMVAYEKELKHTKYHSQKLIFSISKLTSNHGQSVLRPILAILIIASIFVFFKLGLIYLYYRKCQLDSFCCLCFKPYILPSLFDLFLNIVFPPIFKDIKINNLKTSEFIGVILIILAKIFNSIMYWQINRAVRKNIKR